VIAVDREGKIYSADYQGGRVQVFDSGGKFLTQWFVEDKASVIYSLAANRKGTIFITQPGRLLAYEGSTGKLLNEAKHDITSKLSVTAEGKIIAANRNDILILDEFLKIASAFKNAAQNAGIKNGLNCLAVNGLGEIFATSDDGKDLVKFSSDGKFTDRFKIKPTSVQDLAIDSKGRIFISTGSQIFVYSTDGNLLDSFNANQCFALIFNDNDELVTASRPFIVKYSVNR
jgi:ligand-binding sensor domain-containing protein